MEKLRTLRLSGMVKAFEHQLKTEDMQSLSFDDRLGMLADHEMTERENRVMNTRLKTAKLKEQACVENIDFRHTREIEKSTVRTLATCQWIAKHRFLLVTGSTGTGKTYMSCALAHRACQHGYRTLYTRAPRLFHDLSIARADGSYNRLLSKLAKTDLLLIDDFGLVALNDDSARDLLEVIDDRVNTRSTLIASQFPVDTWHQTIANATFADAILDRVVHNSYKLKLKGPSLRDRESPENEDQE